MASVAYFSLIEVEDEEIIHKIKHLNAPYYIDSDSDIEICFVNQVETTPSWYVDIYQYLKDQIIPQYFDINKNIRLKRITIKYVIISEVLYRISFDGAILICLTHHKTIIALQKVHDDLCGGHFFENFLVH